MIMITMMIVSKVAEPRRAGRKEDDGLDDEEEVNIIIIIIIIIFVIIIWCPWTMITWSCCWCNILSKTFLRGEKVKVASVSRKVHLVRENMCGSPLWSDSR